jgi:hypothetical protein
MKASEVAMTPSCEECGRVWLAADADRRRAHRADNPWDGDRPQLVFYPACAFREFGEY